MNMGLLREGTLGILAARDPVRPLCQHIDATVHWLLCAQKASKDGGASAGYHLLRNIWLPSYPETTGYIIPALLQYMRQSANAVVRNAALRMPAFLLDVQGQEGAIHGWDPNGPYYVFDTGQALFGWLAALQETGEACYAQALSRAADWLVAEQDAAGLRSYCR